MTQARLIVECPVPMPKSICFIVFAGECILRNEFNEICSSLTSDSPSFAVLVVVTDDKVSVRP